MRMGHYPRIVDLNTRFTLFSRRKGDHTIHIDSDGRQDRTENPSEHEILKEPPLASAHLKCR